MRQHFISNCRQDSSADPKDKKRGVFVFGGLRKLGNQDNYYFGLWMYQLKTSKLLSMWKEKSWQKQGSSKTQLTHLDIWLHFIWQCVNSTWMSVELIWVMTHPSCLNVSGEVCRYIEAEIQRTSPFQEHYQWDISQRYQPLCQISGCIQDLINAKI